MGTHDSVSIRTYSSSPTGLTAETLELNTARDMDVLPLGSSTSHRPATSYPQHRSKGFTVSCTLHIPPRASTLASDILLLSCVYNAMGSAFIVSE